jgi:hypothetical protein
MHGAILAELQNFVSVHCDADLRNLQRSYLAIASYDDSDALALVDAAAKSSGKSGGEVLTAFGQHLAPLLLEMDGHLIRREWRTLDLLEHTESTIHRIVRLRDPNAAPPRLLCERLSEHEVLIRYGSPRRLCALAIGLALGVAAHFGEALEAKHRECMQQGAERCAISFRLIAAGSGGFLSG